MTELEKSPATGLAAVRQRTAEPGTMEALRLKIMADRLSAVGTYRAWHSQFEKSAPPGSGDQLGPGYSLSIRGMSSARHTLFWSERLLHHRGESWVDAAAAHLVSIGNAQAIEALSLFAREPTTQNKILFRALDSLGQLGQGRALADGLAAHDGPNAQAAQLEYTRADTRLALTKLPVSARTATEAELLTALESEALSDGTRGSYLFVLGQIGSAASLPRLATLRRTDWGQRIRPEFDEAMASIAQRASGASP